MLACGYVACVFFSVSFFAWPWGGMGINQITDKNCTCPKETNISFFMINKTFFYETTF